MSRIIFHTWPFIAYAFLNLFIFVPQSKGQSQSNANVPPVSVRIQSVTVGFRQRSGWTDLNVSLTYSIRSREPRINRPLACVYVLTENKDGSRKLIRAVSKPNMDNTGDWFREDDNIKPEKHSGDMVDMAKYTSYGTVKVVSPGEYGLFNFGQNRPKILCYRAEIFIDGVSIATWESPSVKSLINFVNLSTNWYTNI